MEAFKQLEGTETEAFGKNSYVCRKELGLPMGFERSLLSSNGSFSTCPYALTDEQEYPKKSPDASFRYKDAAYPFVVIVAHTKAKRYPPPS